MDKIRIFNVLWTSRSAGPSPYNNERTEIFLAGCKKAAEGNPCKGCFNPGLWSSSRYYAEITPEEAFNNIKLHAPHKYITFVGGEPLDQIDTLSELCRLLKKDNFHIIVITHFTLKEQVELFKSNKKSFIKFWHNIDGLVDGQYMENERIWDETKAGDGLHDVIGSGNQIIYDFKRWNYFQDKTLQSYPAGNLESWGMNNENDFTFVFKNNPNYVKLDKTEEVMLVV